METNVLKSTKKLARIWNSVFRLVSFNWLCYLKIRTEKKTTKIVRIPSIIAHSTINEESVASCEFLLFYKIKLSIPDSRLTFVDK